MNLDSHLIPIALITTELSLGGAERCVTELALQLPQHGFAPHVISLAPPPPTDRNSLALRLSQARIPVEYVGVSRTRQVLVAVDRLTRRFREYRPELVQSFLFHANIVAAIAARRAHIDTVVAGLRVAEPARWRGWLTRQVSRDVQQFVCVSHDVRDHALREWKLPVDKLCTIANGCDVASWRTGPRAEFAALGISPGRRALVAIGRLESQKGFDWLIDRMPAVMEMAPAHDLLIVGDGPDRARLHAQRDRLNLHRRVHLCGFRHDTGSILRAADLALIPSRWEGMPNVLLEAMACGIPVIATRAAGVAEVLGPLQSQQLVEQGDAPGFVRAIGHWLQDADRAHLMGLANQQRIAEHFSLPSMVGQYAALYRSLLRQR